MDRVEKLHLSSNAKYGYCFKQGLFVRLYEQSLYWFVHHVKPLKPMPERVKGGEPIVYGGLPVSSFEKLLEKTRLYAEIMDNFAGQQNWEPPAGREPQAEAQEVPSQKGWKWQYTEQPQGASEDFSGFAAWRETLIAAALPQQSDYGSSARNILREIRTFNLANSTPIQAMSAVADWQEFLKNKHSVEG